MKFMKSGKVAVILNGRYAGKKAWQDSGGQSKTKKDLYSKCTINNSASAEQHTWSVADRGPSRTYQNPCGTKERGYGHAIVAGVERYPLKITKNMGKKRVAKRSKVKPFIKVINYNHLMPTRYGLELETLKSVVTLDSFKEPSQREEAKKAIKKLFEERYNSGKNKWFFSKLRF
ncbi:hypothetical protein BGZ52_003171 [Haplosporangium bisporale]|nr:hypothetical protein BGZ52_003171 [Haplosporangium bisporale]